MQISHRIASSLQSALVVLALSGLGGAPPAKAHDLYLTPASNSAPLGEYATFDIMIDFMSEPTLGGGYDIAFDESVLEFVDFQPNLGDPLFLRAPDVLPGLLRGAAFGDFQGLASGSVASLTFYVLADACTEVVLSESSDPSVGPLLSGTTFAPYPAGSVQFGTALQKTNGPPGLIGHWELNGDGVDVGGCGFDGLLESPVAAAGVTGAPDTGLVFDGLDRIDLGTSPILQPDLPVTIALWAKHQCSLGAPNCWLFENDAHPTQYSGISFLLSTANQLYAQIGDGGSPSGISRRSAVAPVVIPQNVWTHLAVVIHSGTDFEFYVDGAQVDPVTISYGGTGSGLVYLGSNAQIGLGAGSFTDGFEGTLDEVHFYNRALSQAEITALPEPGLVSLTVSGAALLMLLDRRRARRLR